MLSQQINKKFSGFALSVLIATGVGACQASSVDVTKPATVVVGDGNSGVPAVVILPKNQDLETLQSEARRVIEWDIAFNNSIMPPAEVRKKIDENCRKIGFARGVIVSMSLLDSKVIADFDCRGAGAS